MLWAVPGAMRAAGQTVRHRQERVEVDPAATEVTQAEAAIESNLDDRNDAGWAMF